MTQSQMQLKAFLRGLLFANVECIGQQNRQGDHMPQQPDQDRKQSQRPTDADITSQPKKQQGDMGTGSELKEVPKSKPSDRSQGSEEAW